MELDQAMRTAAAVRRFQERPVPDAVIHRVLDAARFAASGGNRQPWHVIVVRDQALRTGLQELYLRSWRPFYERQLAAAAQDAAARRPGAVEGNHYAEHLGRVPVHLVVFASEAGLATPFPALQESHFAGGSSVYPFVQNIVLALRAEGLGSSLTMMLNNDEADVKSLLRVPDGLALAAHLGVGWPAGPHPTRLRRRPVEDFTSVDRFDGPPLSLTQAAG